METLAILVAAGRGERLGAARPKAFVEVGGTAMLVWAARAFAEAQGIDAVTAVVPSEALDAARALLRGLPRLHAVVAGGERRQDSVEAGLATAPAGFSGLVLVHDAARPFVTTALIEAVLSAARAAGAALPVLPVVDTVKRVRDGRVLGTLDRSELFGAQTPQVFRRELLTAAYAAARERGVLLTDECVAVEQLGAEVRAVPGSPRNRKITTPADLEWAESLVRQEQLA